MKALAIRRRPARVGLTAAGAKAELQRLNADAGHVSALSDATHPNHQAVKAARQRLVDILSKN